MNWGHCQFLLSAQQRFELMAGLPFSKDLGIIGCQSWKICRNSSPVPSFYSSGVMWSFICISPVVLEITWSFSLLNRNVCFVLRIIFMMLELGEVSSSAPWETEMWINWHSFLKMVGNWLSQTCFLVLQVVLPKRLILTGFSFTRSGEWNMD